MKFLILSKTDLLLYSKIEEIKNKNFNLKFQFTNII